MVKRSYVRARHISKISPSRQRKIGGAIKRIDRLVSGIDKKISTLKKDTKMTPAMMKLIESLLKKRNNLTDDKTRYQRQLFLYP